MLEQAKEGSLSISLAKELSAELSRCRTEREKANEEYRLVRAEANSIDSQYRSLFALRGSVLKELEVSKKRLDSIVQAQEILKQSSINTEQISDIENKLRELEGLLLTAQAKNRLYTLAIEHTVDTCLLCGQTVERGLLLQRLQKMLKEEASVSAKLQKDLSSLKQLEGELRSLEKKQAQASALYPERIELSEKLPQLELELIDLNAQIGELELQRNRASSSADELHSTLLALERKIAELQAKLSSGYDPERLDKLYAQVSEGADFFSRKKLGALIRSRELSYLDLYLKHFASMFGYEDSCKLDNEVSLWYGDIEFPYLSGGMKVALGLAFRLAMMQVFAVNTRILILDEPTVFLDENRVYTLVDLLMRAKEFIPQIIVVSHNPALKEAADSIIEL
jgi:exonuclease SbcC